MFLDENFNLFLWDFWVDEKKSKLYAIYQFVEMASQKSNLVFIERDLL